MAKLSMGRDQATKGEETEPQGACGKSATAPLPRKWGGHAKGLPAPVSNRKRSQGVQEAERARTPVAAAVAAQSGHGSWGVTALASLPDVEVWRGLPPGFGWWLEWPG